MRKGLILFLLAFCLDAFSQVNIWEGSSCKKKVELTPYIVEGTTNNLAVIVCPGG